MQDLLLGSPAETVTLGWLTDSLEDRSFGIILLLLGLLASVPGVSPAAGVMIAFPAGQMVLARRGPVLPRFVAARTFRTQHLASMLGRAVPTLRYLERFIRPRWRIPFAMTKRIVGVTILLVDILLFIPVPLSNLPPALVIVLLSVAYIEEDGLLLCIALVIASGLLVIATGGIWQAIGTAGGIGPHG